VKGVRPVVEGVEEEEEEDMVGICERETTKFELPTGWEVRTECDSIGSHVG